MNESANKKNSGVIVLVVALILIILGLVGYIVYDNTKDEKVNTETKTNSKVDEKKETVEQDVEKDQPTDDGTPNNNDDNNEKKETENKKEMASKVDESKDWVYDATYEMEVSASSYSTSYEKYYAKDIVVPYINVNSSYASSSNEEIKKIFEDAIKNYNKGVKNKVTYVDECSYKKYVGDDVLSVVLTYGIGGTDVVHPKYYTYNVNLKTGEKMSFEDVYTAAGFSSSNIDAKVENAITNRMKKEMANFTSDDYPTGTNFETYNKKSISNYKKSISNKKLAYFLSDKGKLNIVVTLNIPVGTEEFDTIIEVD